MALAVAARVAWTDLQRPSTSRSRDRERLHRDATDASGTASAILQRRFAGVRKVRNLAQFLRKRVCATPEEEVAAISFFISRSASPKRPATLRSSGALPAQAPRREMRAQENGLFYALSFEASLDVRVRRCPPLHPAAFPAATFATIFRAAAGKKNRQGC